MSDYSTISQAILKDFASSPQLLLWATLSDGDIAKQIQTNGVAKYFSNTLSALGVTQNAGEIDTVLQGLPIDVLTQFVSGMKKVMSGDIAGGMAALTSSDTLKAVTTQVLGLLGLSDIARSYTPAQQYTDVVVGVSKDGITNNYRTADGKSFVASSDPKGNQYYTYNGNPYQMVNGSMVMIETDDKGAIQYDANGKFVSAMQDTPAFTVTFTGTPATQTAGYTRVVDGQNTYYSKDGVAPPQYYAKTGDTLQQVKTDPTTGKPMMTTDMESTFFGPLQDIFGGFTSTGTNLKNMIDTGSVSYISKNPDVTYTPVKDGDKLYYQGSDGKLYQGSSTTGVNMSGVPTMTQIQAGTDGKPSTASDGSYVQTQPVSTVNVEQEFGPLTPLVQMVQGIANNIPQIQKILDGVANSSTMPDWAKSAASSMSSALPSIMSTGTAAYGMIEQFDKLSGGAFSNAILHPTTPENDLKLIMEGIEKTWNEASPEEKAKIVADFAQSATVLASTVAGLFGVDISGITQIIPGIEGVYNSGKHLVTMLEGYGKGDYSALGYEQKTTADGTKYYTDKDGNLYMNENGGAFQNKLVPIQKDANGNPVMSADGKSFVKDTTKKDISLDALVAQESIEDILNIIEQIAKVVAAILQIVSLFCPAVAPYAAIATGVAKGADIAGGIADSIPQITNSISGIVSGISSGNIGEVVSNGMGLFGSITGVASSVDGVIGAVTGETSTTATDFINGIFGIDNNSQGQSTTPSTPSQTPSPTPSQAPSTPTTPTSPSTAQTASEMQSVAPSTPSQTPSPTPSQAPTQSPTGADGRGRGGGSAQPPAPTPTPTPSPTPTPTGAQSASDSTPTQSQAPSTPSNGSATDGRGRGGGSSQNAASTPTPTPTPSPTPSPTPPAPQSASDSTPTPTPTPSTPSNGSATDGRNSGNAGDQGRTPTPTPSPTPSPTPPPPQSTSDTTIDIAPSTPTTPTQTTQSASDYFNSIMPKDVAQSVEVTNQVGDDVANQFQSELDARQADLYNEQDQFVAALDGINVNDGDEFSGSVSFSGSTFPDKLNSSAGVGGSDSNGILQYNGTNVTEQQKAQYIETYNKCKNHEELDADDRQAIYEMSQLTIYDYDTFGSDDRYYITDGSYGQNTNVREGYHGLTDASWAEEQARNNVNQWNAENAEINTEIDNINQQTDSATKLADIIDLEGTIGDPDAAEAFADSTVAEKDTLLNNVISQQAVSFYPAAITNTDCTAAVASVLAAPQIDTANYTLTTDDGRSYDLNLDDEWYMSRNTSAYDAKAAAILQGTEMPKDPNDPLSAIVRFGPATESSESQSQSSSVTYSDAEKAQAEIYYQNRVQDIYNQDLALQQIVLNANAQTQTDLATLNNPKATQEEKDAATARIKANQEASDQAAAQIKANQATLESMSFLASNSATPELQEYYTNVCTYSTTLDKSMDTYQASSAHTKIAAGQYTSVTAGNMKTIATQISTATLKTDTYTNSIDAKYAQAQEAVRVNDLNVAAGLVSEPGLDTELAYWKTVKDSHDQANSDSITGSNVATSNYYQINGKYYAKSGNSLVECSLDANGMPKYNTTYSVTTVTGATPQTATPSADQVRKGAGTSTGVAEADVLPSTITIGSNGYTKKTLPDGTVVYSGTDGKNYKYDITTGKATEVEIGVTKSAIVVKGGGDTITPVTAITDSNGRTTGVSYQTQFTKTDDKTAQGIDVYSDSEGNKYAYNTTTKKMDQITINSSGIYTVVSPAVSYAVTSTNGQYSATATAQAEVGQYFISGASTNTPNQTYTKQPALDANGKAMNGLDGKPLCYYTDASGDAFTLQNDKMVAMDMENGQPVFHKYVVPRDISPQVKNSATVDFNDDTKMTSTKPAHTYTQSGDKNCWVDESGNYYRLETTTKNGVESYSMVQLQKQGTELVVDYKYSADTEDENDGATGGNADNKTIYERVDANIASTNDYMNQQLDELQTSPSQENIDAVAAQLQFLQEQKQELNTSLESNVAILADSNSTPDQKEQAQQEIDGIENSMKEIQNQETSIKDALTTASSSTEISADEKAQIDALAQAATDAIALDQQMLDNVIAPLQDLANLINANLASSIGQMSTLLGMQDKIDKSQEQTESISTKIAEALTAATSSVKISDASSIGNTKVTPSTGQGKGQGQGVA